MRTSHIALCSLVCAVGLLGYASESHAQIGTARTGCNSATVPAPEEVIVYVDHMFLGDCRILSLGTYPTNAFFGLPNDSITSVKVGIDAQVHLFWDGPFLVPNTVDGFAVFVRRLGADSSNLTEFPNHLGSFKGWSDATSSIRVIRKSEACPPPGPKQAVFFQHENFRGDCVTKNVGAYDIWDIGLQNDSMSSVRLGSQASVILCHDASFVGCVFFPVGSNLSNLGTTPAGNDVVSSLGVN
jgi:hypothetical protein